MKLDTKTFDEIRLWMYKNARPIEIAMWKCLFEGESADGFVRLMKLYQNPDGGFGNALEPDNWASASSPYQASNALSLLRSVGLFNIDNPIVKDVFRYFENDHSYGDMWAFCIPENDYAPHAPWWNYSEEQNAIESPGISVVIAAQILDIADKESSLYKRAMAVADKVLEMKSAGGDMGGAGLCALVEVLNRDYPEKSKSLFESVKARVDAVIERDPSKWSAYSHRPSEFITSPDSPFLIGNEDVLQNELEYMMTERQAGGVWPVPWSWYDNTEKYSKAFAISENWWKGIIAIRKLLLLKSFNML